MMVFVTSSYLRAYKKILKKQPHLKQTIQNKIDLFIENPKNPSLRSHKLSGFHNNMSFSVADDLRIIYSHAEDGVIFHDIGKHDDVY